MAPLGITDAPILLLVSFHNALRAQLAQLHRLTSSWLEIAFPGRDSILDLLHRFRFIRLVYKYHSIAEDEVIFQALDVHVANVACTYSLEHRGIDDLFNSVFQSLNILLKEDEKFTKHLQTLVFCLETIEVSISQHMLKEEEQVFPLLMQKFSCKEQASLVWQFVCSVPIVLLEDFLPWMVSYLPADEQADVVNCIKAVFPMDKLLQEVVASWLDKQSEVYVCNLSPRADEEVTSSLDESLYMKKFRKIYSSWVSSLYGEICCGGEFLLSDNAKYHPVDGLCLWNGAIEKDLREILEELHEIRSSKVFSTLASISAQIKFFADILIFYSDALEKVFFSALSKVANGSSFAYQRFPEDSWIEGILHLLKNINFEDEISMGKLVENLCWQLEIFLAGLGNHFTFQETEVFPFIRKHFNYVTQQKLLYMSLHMMPLGLLKFVITWLSAHLTEDESKNFLCCMNLTGSEADMPFASLLHDWVRIGYSGKSSLEKFRQELQDMFRNRSSFLSEQIKNSGFSVELDARSCKRFLPVKVKPNSASKVKKSASDSLVNDVEEKDITLESSAIDLHILFPDYLKEVSPFSKYLSDKSEAGSSLSPEFKPIDYIFLFHKALKNDLNYFVHLSSEMAENVGFLVEFRQRFDLIHFLYRVHSANEDDIAFPALEAKGKLKNISLSYTIDHKLEVEHFHKISNILDEISRLNVSRPSENPTVVDVVPDHEMLKYHNLCLKIHGTCKIMCVMLEKHFQCEEIELWPLFTEHFSIDEQEKIIGSILGRTRAEVLQKMIPWLMASLSSAEQHALMSLWRKATKNTMFNEWLKEWWQGMSRHDIETVVETNMLPSRIADPLEIAARYLCKEANSELDERNPHIKELTFLQCDTLIADTEPPGNADRIDETKFLNGGRDGNQCIDCSKIYCQDYKEGGQKVINFRDQVKQQGDLSPAVQKFSHHKEHSLRMSQDNLEAAVRKVSRDTTLNPKEKSYIIQNLLMSRWVVTQQRPHQEITLSSIGQIPGQHPSYRDSVIFGCKHYKRNCKLFAACCNKLFTCRYCHDEEADHSMERKSTTNMMCMKCLKVQPVGATCSNISCNGLSMGKYFCSICRLYDDEREIYHCPYCNLCRVGKGLGIDYFHCMNCNACMSKSLSVHICREKCFESNCPICREDIFTSSSPVKALPCGHLMHSNCFQDYTCIHYTCPICSKSLGDMQVYFRMLDALLAEEKVPQEYNAKTQVILCNDCEKRGVAPFHWHYHKCPHCGSYNTRLL